MGLAQVRYGFRPPLCRYFYEIAIHCFGVQERRLYSTPLFRFSCSHVLPFQLLGALRRACAKKTSQNHYNVPPPSRRQPEEDTYSTDVDRSIPGTARREQLKFLANNTE